MDYVQGKIKQIRDSYLFSNHFTVHMDHAKVFLFFKGDVNIKALCDGDTFLYRTVENNDFENAKFFIKKKADVNLKTLNGDLPLVAAISKHNYSMVQLLIAYKADIHLESICYIERSHKTCFAWAISSNHYSQNESIIKLLLDYKADVASCWKELTGINRRMGTIRFLHQLRVDFYKKDKEKKTIFDYEPLRKWRLPEEYNQLITFLLINKKKKQFKIPKPVVMKILCYTNIPLGQGVCSLYNYQLLH